MAKLPQQTGGSGLQIKSLAPAGQHIATCLRVVDLFGVERPSFENPQVKEIKDVTRFIFGLIGPDGKEYLVQTYEFSISAAPGANLMKFLKTWLGRDATVGWDYAEMKGQGAMLTIQHKASKTNAAQLYANISGISPVFPALQAHVQPASRFEPMLAALERESASAAPTGGATPPPLPTPPPAYPPQGQTPPPPPAPKQLSPDGKYELVNNQWVPVQAAPPPPPPQPMAPPPPPPLPATPPPPPTPPAPVIKCFVHLAGQAQPATLATLQGLLAQGQGATPALIEGDTSWSTAAALVAKFTGAPASAPGFPPPPRAGGNPNLDEDVPF